MSAIGSKLAAMVAMAGLTAATSTQNIPPRVLSQVLRMPTHKFSKNDNPAYIHAMITSKPEVIAAWNAAVEQRKRERHAYRMRARAIRLSGVLNG